MEAGLSEQQTLFDLESLTIKNTQTIISLQEEIKKLKEAISDGYANNPVYRDQSEKVKDQKKGLDSVKSEIVKSQTQLEVKLRDLQAELRDKKRSVSDYALEYSRMANTSTIEIEGKMYDIVKTAKLVKRSK